MTHALRDTGGADYMLLFFVSAGNVSGNKTSQKNQIKSFYKTDYVVVDL